MDDYERVGLLIKILLDPSARVDEKDDVAMDLGDYDDERALFALFEAGSNLNEDSMVLDSCGESIGEILIRKNDFRKKELNKLPEDTKVGVKRIFRHYRPEWKLD